MKNLIIYYSRRGSTLEQVEKLAARLEGETQISNIKDNPALEGYDNIILGGAVIAGEIKGGMRKYAEKNQAILLKKKIGLFSCCLDPSEDGIKRYLSKTFPAEIYAHASARLSLGGRMRLSDEGFFVKLLMKLIGANEGEKFIDENIDKLADIING